MRVFQQFGRMDSANVRGGASKMVWPLGNEPKGVPPPHQYRSLPPPLGQRVVAPTRILGNGPSLLHCVYSTSSLLLKVLLLLATFILLLTALSVIFPWLFPSPPASGSPPIQPHLVAEEQMLKEFMDFQRKYPRAYKSDEERLMRFQMFILNMRELGERIRRERELGEDGLTEWGVTEYFDWTEQELAKLVMPSKASQQYFGKQFQVEPMAEYRPEKPGYKRPKQWDWREKGVVTHVKNQLQCGSCWAFATVATVESLYAIHRNGTLVTLSEQQMIDCDLSQNGCEGGFRPNAFRYVRDNGLLSDSVYPYRGNEGKCRLPPGPVDPSRRVFVDQFRSLPSDEDQIADWLVEKGPASFGMNVTKGMYQYRSGIFSPSMDECAHGSMGSHAMEVVGFGENGQEVPYWIMKNSWGSGFGVNGGYLLMRRGLNACGLTREVYSAEISRHW